MKKFNPAKLLFGFFGLATGASLIGSVSASLAWYAYSTRAALSYSGTSVKETAQLQIGFASPVAINFADSDNMSLEQYQNDSNFYYFAPIGHSLSSSILNKYLEANGFATNYLIPITSGSYTRGDAWVSPWDSTNWATNGKLKQSPNPDNDIYTYAQSKVATRDHFASFQFLFRVAKKAFASSTDYVSGQELWLTDAVAHAYSDNEYVNKSLRIYVDRINGVGHYEDDFIFNPSSTSLTGGETKVGGLLDVAGNGYYDYDDDNNEIIFGEYTNTSDRSTTGYAGADEYVDINGTGRTSVAEHTMDTFTGKHMPGVKYYDTLEHCGIKTAAYESLRSIAPKRSSGVLSNVDEDHPTSLCKTGTAEDHFLGRVNMTVWLEGWDFSIIDQEIGKYFDIGLTFEINRVNA